MDVKGSLKSYFEILRGERKARYLVTKEVRVSFDPEASLDELWKIHDLGMVGGHEEGDKTLLDLKLLISERILESCHLCERRCGVNRKEGEVGYCGVDAVSRIASEFLHWGEEEEIIPSHTIFFTGCTFSCVYCQNWDIATSPQSGVPALPELVCEMITRRKMEGAKNVNFVGGDPTPHIPAILRVLNHCRVNTPIIFNSNMYLSDEAMRLLEGVVDLYLGDFRYGNDRCAKKYSDVDRYWEITRRNFLHAKDHADILMRHLVLPAHVECCTRPIIEWVAANLKEVRFNLMFQYRPCYRAHLHPEIDRYLTTDEMMDATRLYETLLKDV
ncbi:MAG: radical SAM protein [Candidatus Syntrophoarchaeum sp. WYZ-LMO15]|nr:MAG: radical SAM protein [Candidatus Syntrophoarchaeum sp. WYZ-LMO15]